MARLGSTPGGSAREMVAGEFNREYAALCSEVVGKRSGVPAGSVRVDVTGVTKPNVYAEWIMDRTAR